MKLKIMALKKKNHGFKNWARQKMGKWSGRHEVMNNIII